MKVKFKVNHYYTDYNDNLKVFMADTTVSVFNFDKFVFSVRKSGTLIFIPWNKVNILPRKLK